MAKKKRMTAQSPEQMEMYGRIGEIDPVQAWFHEELRRKMLEHQAYMAKLQEQHSSQQANLEAEQMLGARKQPSVDPAIAEALARLASTKPIYESNTATLQGWRQQLEGAGQGPLERTIPVGANQGSVYSPTPENLQPLPGDEELRAKRLAQEQANREYANVLHAAWDTMGDPAAEPTVLDSSAENNALQAAMPGLDAAKIMATPAGKAWYRAEMRRNDPKYQEYIAKVRAANASGSNWEDPGPLAFANMPGELAPQADTEQMASKRKDVEGKRAEAKRLARAKMEARARGVSVPYLEMEKRAASGQSPGSDDQRFQEDIALYGQDTAMKIRELRMSAEADKARSQSQENVAKIEAGPKDRELQAMLQSPDPWIASFQQANEGRMPTTEDLEQYLALKQRAANGPSPLPPVTGPTKPPTSAADLPAPPATPSAIRKAIQEETTPWDALSALRSQYGPNAFTTPEQQNALATILMDQFGYDAMAELDKPVKMPWNWETHNQLRAMLGLKPIAW